MVSVRHCPTPSQWAPRQSRFQPPGLPYFIACVYSWSWFLFLPSFAWHFTACNIKDALHPPSVWVKSLIHKFFFSTPKSGPQEFTWCHWPSGNTTMGQAQSFEMDHAQLDNIHLLQQKNCAYRSYFHTYYQLLLWRAIPLKSIFPTHFGLLLVCLEVKQMYGHPSVINIIAQVKEHL